MRESKKTQRFTISISVILIFLCSLGIVVVIGIPEIAARQYGPPSSTLGFRDQIEFSARVLWYGNTLIQPRNPDGTEKSFTIDPGENINSIATRLEGDGIIRSREAFRTYLVYTGLDTSIQAGSYLLSPALSIVDIAHELQDATPNQITFVILPGWRMEEIAESLVTSGLEITPDEFLSAANNSRNFMDYLPSSSSTEGFLYPDAYILSRDTTADMLVKEFLRNFDLHLTIELREGFAKQGLDIYQAITLASIVQKEAVVPEEGALVASVFYNRLNLGMKLDTDPTVQYSLGYNSEQATWWTNPLSAGDLQIDSPYNTYLYPGLPPGPISNPSLPALQAVAFPDETLFYYFRARCDGSGLHDFAVTFEEHLQNGCQ